MTISSNTERRLALEVSLVLHGCVLGFAVFWPVSTGSVGSDQNSAPLNLLASPADHSGTTQAASVRVQQTVPSVAHTFSAVKASLNSWIDKSQQHSVEENQDQLTQLGARLETISSPQAVDELTEHLSKWIGISDRADVPPEEPTEGDIDIATAQIHQVRRVGSEPNEPGGYIAVLIDAEGRTIEVELSTAEGAPLYETMQRLQALPLAEKIYRQLVMPLLDQLIRENQRVISNGTSHATIDAKAVLEK